MPNITPEELAKLGLQTPEQLQSLLTLMGAKQREVDSNPSVTKLEPRQEAMFRRWLVESGTKFDPSDLNPAYDMRGYYKSLMSGATNPQYTEGSATSPMGNKEQLQKLPPQFDMSGTPTYRAGVQKMLENAMYGPLNTNYKTDNLLNTPLPHNDHSGLLFPEIWGKYEAGGWDDGRQ